ncbi:putative transposase [Leekyejoonella antrihumi]|uniref:Helix-turn-helix domain containing protein n=1 Tax=Leekyejoonella antrihumi TaxID=1660198 RepID=A0A563DP43_9MICO|nr:helix-turn-helix domain containing protein [Leekyejoonella antrihumi]TWP31987.1 helix-turn-helix domain containing protein [Leekyejoonella antrihumi]
MTSQAPLPLTPATAAPIGAAAALLEDVDGGRVFIHGELAYAFDAGDAVGRRLAAVQLVRIKAASLADVAAGFGVDETTVWRWGRRATAAGVAGLGPGRRGPKGPSKLTGEMVARIIGLSGRDMSLRAIARTVGVSLDSVRRVLADQAPAKESEPATGDDERADDGDDAAADLDGEQQRPDTSDDGGQLPVLADPAPRHAERGMARWGLLEHAHPIFTPSSRVPLAGLFLALPGLAATGLLGCARGVFGPLPNGFYGLDTVLVEAALRALAGQPRAEGATRVDPIALGRVLGLDRAPEVKTIRRKLHLLAGTGKAGELIAAMAARHLNPIGTRTGDGAADEDPAAVLYVDGHVRAYHGRRKIAKTHLSRLKFPAPATVETWISDAAGDPVMVVMSEPGASLAGELRRLLPDLRAAIGDDRRVLVGFDRGGWSPALFQHMAAHGFDVLTWRKGHVDDLPATEFDEHTLIDEAGRTHTWGLADTMVDLPTDDKGNTVTLRQVTRLDDKDDKDSKQVHILTTRVDLHAADVVYRMGGRWRLENAFRYGRIHLDLDSHDAYAASDDDPDRLVPNPAKKKTYKAVIAARTAHEQATTAADQALAELRTPAPGATVVITNADYNAATAGQRVAETALAAAEQVHQDTPARLPLREVNPGQQVLDSQMKLLTHAIKIAAFNTTTALARDLRIHTGYARANKEAHTLIRHVLTQSGDIHPDAEAGALTIRLDPMPTRRATVAIAQLCEHLTATKTVYPDTDLVLRYEIKTRR